MNKIYIGIVVLLLCIACSKSSPSDIGNDFLILDVQGNVNKLISGSKYENVAGDNFSLWKVIIDHKNRFVAIGDGGVIQFSTTGKEWQLINSGTTKDLADIVVDKNGHFVAVGDDGIILFSEDGRYWRSQRSKTNHHFRSVAVNNNGIFVAVGDDLPIVVSNDGIHWNKVEIAKQISVRRIVANSKGEFVAIGSKETTKWSFTPIVLYSNNGVNWQINELKTDSYLTELIVNKKDQFLILTGNYGVLFSNNGKDWFPLCKREMTNNLCFKNFFSSAAALP